jgi:hypothetical protein
MNSPVGQICAHVPVSHGARWQSPSALHPLPGGQAWHVAPPQSMSVSAPFFRPSVQLAAVHVPVAHFPLWQSLPVEHPWPSGHFGHVAPPQSTPVSPPL